MLNAQQVIERISADQVIKLCCELQGTDTFFRDSYGNPIFNTCLDRPGEGDSWKLYYFMDSKKFYVFTTGEGYNLFELVRRARELNSFKESFDFVVEYFGFKRSIDGFTEDAYHEEDISVPCTFQKPIKKDRIINENILELFYPLASPTEWKSEGISTAVMNHYGIRCDASGPKIIIPQRDVNGNLVGIRGRSFNSRDLSNGRKYMPVKIEKDLYNCPLGNHLYGLYYNKDFIRQIDKVLLVEAEKSVLQMSSFYGIDKCYAVATCGFNVSDEQIDLLLSLGVRQVILGFDRDFLGHGKDPDVVEYEKKVLRVARPLLAYFDVYYIIDREGLLPYKASPTDCGEKIYRQLLTKKELINDEDYW